MPNCGVSTLHETHVFFIHYFIRTSHPGEGRYYLLIVDEETRTKLKSFRTESRTKSFWILQLIHGFSSVTSYFSIYLRTNEYIDECEITQYTRNM